MFKSVQNVLEFSITFEIIHVQGRRGVCVCVCDMLGNKAAQKMCMIMGKNGYIVLSLVKILLFYPNFSQKYVLFVKKKI